MLFSANPPLPKNPPLAGSNGLAGKNREITMGSTYLFIICLFIFTLPHFQQANRHECCHLDRELIFKCEDINIVATRYGPVAV